jgi:ABC-type multidrug transport system ATPase subunit
MELFQCADIPLTTSTKSYSGGEKLRVSLVRAFNLGEVIIINTNTNSLDSKMQHKVKENIRALAKGAYS